MEQIICDKNGVAVKEVPATDDTHGCVGCFYYYSTCDAIRKEDGSIGCLSRQTIFIQVEMENKDV